MYTYILLYSASEWIFLDLWRFINVLIIIFPATLRQWNKLPTSQLIESIYPKRTSFVALVMPCKGSVQYLYQYITEALCAGGEGVFIFSQ